MPKYLMPALIAPLLVAATLAHAADPTHRTFLFTYAGAVTGLNPGREVRVWLPVAHTNQDQVVELVRRTVPGRVELTADPRHENSFLYFQAPAGPDGTIGFSVLYRVTRNEVAEETPRPRADDSRYLNPGALVPVGGKPAQVLLSGRPLPADPLQKGRLLYDLVDDRLTYRKDQPGWGRGDAAWACDSGFGNCTDFHSLFISLARSVNIPAKFEIGFAIPPKRGKGEVAGYHCWAKFEPTGHGWVPVDISEANRHPDKREYFFGRLDPDRVMFSTGRDLQLVPRQSSPPVNFLVYPYVEVGGRAQPPEKFKPNFAYEDVNPPAAGK